MSLANFGRYNQKSWETAVTQTPKPPQEDIKRILLVRIAFDSGQTRSIVTNILGRQQGMTQPLLKTTLEESGRSAKSNIMRRTPQISELINSVEQWMLEENRGEKARKSV